MRSLTIACLVLAACTKRPLAGNAGGTIDVDASVSGDALVAGDAYVPADGFLPADVFPFPDARVLTDAPAGPTRVVGLSAREFHTCVLHANGTVSCWGLGEDGVLGSGEATLRPMPALVPGLTDAVEVATGATHTCVRRLSGAMACWGGNRRGQLGDGAASHGVCTTYRDCSFVPVAVQGIGDAVEISVGDDTSCARLADGTVWCWGDNADGTLGNGSQTTSNVPVRVSGLTDATSVSVGENSACAVRLDGTVWCWGANVFGELGAGPSANATCDGLPCALQPVRAIGIDDAVAVSAGHLAACARLRSGAAMCWGEGYNGQIGDGLRVNRDVPTPVQGVTDFVTIFNGGQRSCGMRADGSGVCWGATVGHQTPYINQPAPVPVEGLPGDVVEFAGGVDHLCARTVAGAVFCWGHNGGHQLGDGTDAYTPTPQRVPAL